MLCAGCAGIISLVPLNRYPIPRPMIFVEGQSNVAGFQDISNLEVQYQQTYNNVQFFRHSTTMGLAFSPMSYLDNPSYQAPEQDTKYALQFYLYPQLAALLAKDLFVVQHAQGNTSLSVDWLSTTSGSYYSQAVFKSLSAIRGITSCDGVAPSVKFMIWGQGETDAAGLGSANAYETNLTNYINNFRTAVGLPNLPILIMRINSNIDAVTFPYWNTVRTAQTNVAGSLSNVYLVNQDNATMAAGNIHYTNAGYQQIATNVITVVQANNLLS